MDSALNEKVNNLCREAMKQHSDMSNIAAFLKEKLDSEEGPNWHCIVGKEFGR